MTGFFSRHKIWMKPFNIYAEFIFFSCNLLFFAWLHPSSYYSHKTWMLSVIFQPFFLFLKFILGTFSPPQCGSDFYYFRKSVQRREIFFILDLDLHLFHQPCWLRIKGAVRLASPPPTGTFHAASYPPPSDQRLITAAFWGLNQFFGVGLFYFTPKLREKKHKLKSLRG